MLRATQLGESLTGVQVNYKLAGSGGFSPHIDSTAYTHVKKIKHLTILMAADASNMSNGGLEVVEGSHMMEVPIDSSNCIEPKWVENQKWVSVELEPGMKSLANPFVLFMTLKHIHIGQLLIFGSYLAHRSAANYSSSDRKAIYATYNCKSEGDLHDTYYEGRAKLWPPTHKRQDGAKYEAGAFRYAYGSPMLSVDMGKQFVV